MYRYLAAQQVEFVVVFDVYFALFVFHLQHQITHILSCSVHYTQKFQVASTVLNL